MSSINQSIHATQHQFNKISSTTDSYDFFNLLTSPELLDKTESLLPEHRERLFPPIETLSMFLAQVMSQDGSCQSAVNDSAVKRLFGGLTTCSTATGGYCKARARLPLNMASTLSRYTAKLMVEQTPKHWQHRGRPVRLIDGTTASMPDTQANQSVYPQPASQKQGLGFPLCRIVGITCLVSGALLDAAIGPCKGKGSSEQDLLRQMLGTFEPGDIVLGDAYFGSYFFLAWLIEHKVDAVFEQMGARKTDFTQGQLLGVKDHIVKLQKPKRKPAWMPQEQFDQAPRQLSIRETKVAGKVLITTLISNKEYKRKQLSDLYKSRWHIELDLRDIKTTLGMNLFRCTTPQMVEKEMWTYLLAYNLIRLLMVQTAVLAKILPRQISFKHTLQLWLSWSRYNTNEGDKELTQLLIMIAQNKVGNRAGRVEPRAVKKRPKPLPLLTITRQQARAEIAKNGHPKKLK
ncbi:hypothetical protein MNBD_GAMMA02-1321 [hydrothermal vent metagenome]|uniref:Transposase IS4-like domain-containing protein n=1 Tax=hydrothermal vent metagenome TaxID=652676 RepID=A0A3B0VTZ7_9ZZZZ